MDVAEQYRSLLSVDHKKSIFNELEDVLPGDMITSDTSYLPGPGVLTNKNGIFASVMGTVIKVESENEAIKYLTVLSERQKATKVPRTGSIVLGIVTKVTHQKVECDIRVCDDDALDKTFKGILRLQDVRQYETDLIKLFDCFKPQDIIRAVVISMGDSKSYMLSTASNTLGVITGVSQDGGELIPQNWMSMKCSLTGKLECRKVARPVTDEELN